MDRKCWFSTGSKEEEDGDEEEALVENCKY